MLSGTYHFVRHRNVSDFLQLGWIVCADLGPTHGEWSCLMRWLCNCRPATPFDSHTS
jgi:hypothetical protein